MAEDAITIWRQWPKPARLSLGLLCSAASLAVVYMFVAGTPRPVLPSSSLFEAVSIEQTLSSSRPELSSFDFIFRPVFAMNRKPPVQSDLPSEDEAALAAAEAAAVVESIEGVSLLGIFGSGEVAGIIIRLGNGDRQRLAVGEKLKGWTLRSVAPRSAIMWSGNGEEAKLEMVFSVAQTPLTTEVRLPPQPQIAESPDPATLIIEDATARGESDGTSVKAATLTFDQMYDGKRVKPKNGRKKRD